MSGSIVHMLKPVVYGGGALIGLLDGALRKHACGQARCRVLGAHTPLGLGIGRRPLGCCATAIGLLPIYLHSRCISWFPSTVAQELSWLSWQPQQSHWTGGSGGWTSRAGLPSPVESDPSLVP